jgi:hypothetical protein
MKKCTNLISGYPSIRYTDLHDCLHVRLCSDIPTADIKISLHVVVVTVEQFNLTSIYYFCPYRAQSCATRVLGSKPAVRHFNVRSKTATLYTYSKQLRVLSYQGIREQAGSQTLHSPVQNRQHRLLICNTPAQQQHSL